MPRRARARLEEEEEEEPDEERVRQRPRVRVSATAANSVAAPIVSAVVGEPAAAEIAAPAARLVGYTLAAAAAVKVLEVCSSGQLRALGDIFNNLVGTSTDEE